MRLKGWEQALRAVIAWHRQAPFEYDVSECFRLPMDGAISITGEDPLKDARGYKTAQGAGKVLKKFGCVSVADLFGIAFPEIPPAFAGRGDIGAVETEGQIAGCIVAGHELIGKAETGLVFFPRTALLRAFRVG